MLTLCSARAWQSLPSVPGRSSRRIVNSLLVGIRNLLTVYLGDGLAASCEIQRCLESYSCNLDAFKAVARTRQAPGVRFLARTACGQRRRWPVHVVRLFTSPRGGRN